MVMSETIFVLKGGFLGKIILSPGLDENRYLIKQIDPNARLRDQGKP